MNPAIHRLVTQLLRAVAALLLCRDGLVAAEPPGFESFEKGVPAFVSATRPASVSVSPWHNKHGRNSLRWEWAKGEELILRHDIGDIARTGGFLNKASFSVWLYIEKPVAGALLFEFREGKEVTGSFRFPMNFSGWRQARLHYDSFPQGKPTSKVNNIRVAAPIDAANGVAYFDSLGFNLLSYPSQATDPGKLSQRPHPMLDERRFPKLTQITEAEAEGLRKLKGPPPKPRKVPGVADAAVNELCDKVKDMGVIRDEHGVHGPGLDSRSYYCAAPGEYGGKDIRFWRDELGPDGTAMQSPKPFNDLATLIAKTYHNSNDESQRRRLADIFLLLADFIQDQGESLLPDAVTTMRAALAENGRFESHFEALVRSRGGDQSYVAEGQPVRSNMDFYSHYNRHLMELCFIPPEQTDQVRWMNAWRAMMEQSHRQPSGAFKIDGSAYHHNGHYHSYAQGAFGNMPRHLRELRDTPWRLSPELHERLRRAMLAQRLYANRYDLPLSLKGRSPFAPGLGIILPYGVKAMDALAQLGTPDGREAIDREVAAAYLRFAPEAAGKEPYLSLGIQPEPEPNGTFVMPYAALLAHRRDDWLICVRGQSRYCWGSERQARRNCFGPFMSFGSLEVLAGGKPVTAKASGCDGAGWNWSRFEGTTAPQLPLADLEQAWPPNLEVTRSPEKFVGGLSHFGRQGVFAMVMNQQVTPGGKSIRGRKSWFFSDQRVLCLGSGISCDDARFPTQTPLYQKSLRNGEMPEIHPTTVDGTDLVTKKFPDERMLDSAQPHWFLDIQQTGYFVPAGQTLGIARRHQTSRDVNDWENTEGDFLTAWLDHGPSPTNASYEYLLAVRATSESIRQIVAQPPYRVLQRDDTAHIV
jgi:chondroitin-sulfate-ABC endolyase/exolyase